MSDPSLPLEHVHLPPGTDADGPHPVVVVLHGRGADEEDLVPVARRLPDRFHTLSLRAPNPLMGGYTWYELDLSGGGLETSQPDPEDFDRSRELIRESIAAGAESYGFDRDAVGVFGFSQGAITSFALLLEHPNSYAWCVGLHGYLAASHADLDPDGIAGKPVFIGAGERDQIIPASRAEAAADRFRDLGAAVTFETFPTGHGIGSEELEAVVGWVRDRVGDAQA